MKAFNDIDVFSHVESCARPSDRAMKYYDTEVCS